MIIKIKKYVAKVAKFVEHDNGSITKEVFSMTLGGQRFSEASVLKRIPHDVKLISHGYEKEAYEVDADALHEFCKENGKPVVKVNNDK